MAGNWFKKAVEKLVDKVKNVGDGTPVDSQTTHLDLSSYVLVADQSGPTDVSYEVQEDQSSAESDLEYDLSAGATAKLASASRSKIDDLATTGCHVQTQQKLQNKLVNYPRPYGKENLSNATNNLQLEKSAAARESSVSSRVARNIEPDRKTNEKMKETEAVAKFLSLERYLDYCQRRNVGKESQTATIAQIKKRTASSPSRVPSCAAPNIRTTGGTVPREATGARPKGLSRKETETQPKCLIFENKNNRVPLFNDVRTAPLEGHSVIRSHHPPVTCAVLDQGVGEAKHRNTKIGDQEGSKAVMMTKFVKEKTHEIMGGSKQHVRERNSTDIILQNTTPIFSGKHQSNEAVALTPGRRLRVGESSSNVYKINAGQGDDTGHTRRSEKRGKSPAAPKQTGQQRSRVRAVQGLSRSRSRPRPNKAVVVTEDSKKNKPVSRPVSKNRQKRERRDSSITATRRPARQKTARQLEEKRTTIEAVQHRPEKTSAARSNIEKQLSSVRGLTKKSKPPGKVDIISSKTVRGNSFPTRNSPTKKPKTAVGKKGNTTRVDVVLSDQSSIERKVIEGCFKDLLPSQLSFSIKGVETSGGNNLQVQLDFPSGNQGRKAVAVINKSGKIKAKACLMNKEVVDGKEKCTNLVSRQVEEVMLKGYALTESHQDRIDEMQVKVESLMVKKHVPLHLYDKIRVEREAVESKLEELRRQKEEFSFQHQRILKRLQALEEQKQPTNEANELTLEFNRECRKLTSALPIYARRKDILGLFQENPVTIILGETGSGKSTQLVQFLYQANSLGLGDFSSGTIVCTQPRKVAAQSLANHVADEMGSRCGGLVGYKTGFQAVTSASTRIVFTTDHSLLNECLKDPNLEKYSCIIIDEAHERSIYTDLLLGMIKKCLTVRSDLRLIVTSATIDPDVFVRYFDGAPVLRVSGRMYPVDVIYNHPSEPSREDYLKASVEKVREIHQLEPEGDILVFLTSPLETQKACERVGAMRDIVCLPLHGQLQSQEQQAVFEPVANGCRKVVFATNSAETSITIPGIKYVVDTGFVKEKVFDSKRNMSALIVKPISKSSAEQRMGRAGRVSSGKCYRLYHEEEFQAMEPISPPEIMRVHLGQALLKLMEIGITDPLQFDFVQSPSRDALHNAMDILRDLRAVDTDGITEMGKKMALLPVEPRMAKVIFDAMLCGCALEGIAVAALSSVGGVFYRMGSEEDKKQADYYKTKFCQEAGDIHTFLHVYKEWDAVPERQRSAWCVRNHINGKSIRICREVIQDIRKILKKDLRIDIQYKFSEDSNGEALSTILLDCFKFNLGYYTGHTKLGYYVVNDTDEERRFLQIHPSSSLSYLASTPSWVVYLDVLKTSNDYMMNVVTINYIVVQKKIEAGELFIDQTKLARVTLGECVVAEVGSTLMSFLIGSRFESLKSTEKELVDKYNRPLVLDVHREKCQMKVFTIPKLFKYVQAFMTEKLAPEKYKLKKEMIQMPVTFNSSTRAVIEAGGECSGVLMPDETRTLLLRRVPDCWTVAHVELELQRYGEITNVEPYTRKGRGENATWGKVIFDSATCAEFAMRTYEGNLQLVPDGVRKSDQSRNEFKVKVKWCRRPARDFAFVKPRDPRDVNVLTGLRKMINGTAVNIKKAKDDESKLFVSKLSSGTTEDDVRNALSTLCDIENVFIPRVKVGETKPEMLQALTGRLGMRIRDFAEPEEFSVKILQPKPVSFEFFGYIFFNNPEAGLDAINGLNGTVFDGQKLYLNAELRASLHVQRDIYAAMQSQIEETSKDLGRSFRSARINIRQLKSGHFAVNLEADEVNTMLEVRNSIQRLISGQQLEFSTTQEEQALFSHAGRDMLSQLQRRLNVFIRVDSRLRIITAYGDLLKVTKVRQEVTAFLLRFQGLKTKEIYLRGDGRPAGLMKHLLVEHGLDMETLRRETGVHILSLNLQKHQLKATGSPEALEKLGAAVTAASTKLLENATAAQPDDIDCMVCFCPIDGAVYRLEYCGHPYCSDCIVGLIRSGMTDKRYPIMCAQEDCQHPLIWKDFNNWLGGDQRQELVKSAIDNFVAQNAKKYKFCTTPDCSMVYRIGYNEGCPHQCTGCGVSVCTSCHVQYHYGLTCGMYRSKGKDSDYELQQWMKEDPLNRKVCPNPNCKAHIEKNGGCMRVHCKQCNMFICWRCMKIFQNGSDAYDHLAKYCGGIYDAE